MNKYMNFLLKNFGGSDKLGLKYISEILNNYNIHCNLSAVYKEYEKNNKLKGSSERCIRHYVDWCINIHGIKEIEKILQCKRDKENRFTNKAFILAIKYRVEGRDNEKMV